MSWIVLEMKLFNTKLVLEKIKRLKYVFTFQFTAGRQTTNEELEEMLEQGNPAVFTQGVSFITMFLVD